MKKGLPVAAAVIGLAVLLLVALPQRDSAQQTLRENGGVRVVPDFALTDFAGRTVRSEEFSGRPRVINSWAVWCSFCKKELGDFAAVQREFGERVTIIAIDRAEPLSLAKGFTDQIGITEDLIFLLDPDDTFYKAINGFSMPETIFVDENGMIVFHKRGPMELSEIRERITTLIN